MTIAQAGALNLTALIVPDLIVQIVPPSISLLNGVPTNVLGLVGTATWGPVNAPTIIGDAAAYARQFGAIQPRKYDMGTCLAAAVLQGASNFKCVRITDNTDTAAFVVLPTAALTVTSKYSGSLANGDQFIISAGSQANTFKATIARANITPEVFDNIPGTGNAFWVNLANAINNGQTGQRGPSQLIVASAGAGTNAPALATYTLTGGTDGAATITGSTLIGVDTTPRKGMYALRNSGASVAVLVDCDDTTTFTTQIAYGLAEGTYMIGTGPSGDTISNAVTVKATAGVDSYAFKYMFGDWVYFNDTVNGGQRLISPQGFIAGLLSNLSPQNSSLNKPMYGIVGTQKSSQNLTYSNAELQQLAQVGIDVITNPIPAGAVFGARIGHNSSSNAVTNGDNYTRMTNYIAATINAGMGKFIGTLQSQSQQRSVAATISTFFDNMYGQGMIGSSDGTLPYSVQCDSHNNPQSRVALGYEQVDCKVKYLSVVEKLIVNLEGSQATVISRQTTAAA